MENFNDNQEKILEIYVRINALHNLQMALYSEQIRSLEKQDFGLMGFNNKFRDAMPIKTLTNELQLAQQELKLLIKCENSVDSSKVKTKK